MTFAVGRGPAAAPASAVPPKEDARIHEVAEQMSGSFAEQLFKAMRETVPQGEGAFDGGSGEEMFSGLMDQRLAAETPTQWARGLTDAIVRQLRRALDAQGGPASDPMPGDGAKARVLPLESPPAALAPLHPQTSPVPLQQTPQFLSLPDATR